MRKKFRIKNREHRIKEWFVSVAADNQLFPTWSFKAVFIHEKIDGEFQSKERVRKIDDLLVKCLGRNGILDRWGKKDLSLIGSTRIETNEISLA
jgi:hypothetical protein